MLVVAGGDRTRLDTGSVALALARRLSESDRKALLVDADATGSRLARRCGQALGAPFLPATRGLPTLIAARDPMRVDALAAHCYSLGARPESLWLLFAPDSAAGGRVAAGWLTERAAELRELDRTRRVVVSVPSWQQFDTVLSLLEHASALVHHKHFVGEGPRRRSPPCSGRSAYPVGPRSCACSSPRRTPRRPTARCRESPGSR